MIWNKLKEQVCFENSSTCILWEMPLQDLKEIGNPEIIEEGGQVEIIWRNESLLNGIKGDWTVSTLPPNGMEQPFKKIHISYAGDDDSLKAYTHIKAHLNSIVGIPTVQDEEGRDKELKWLNEENYISLYLFEMHAFRCQLTVGKK